MTDDDHHIDEVDGGISIVTVMVPPLTSTLLQMGKKETKKRAKHEGLDSFLIPMFRYTIKNKRFTKEAQYLHISGPHNLLI
jgi:hypothetical protein